MTVRNFPIRNERHENSLIPVVTIGRRPISGTADTDIRDPKTGKYYERPTFWRVSNLNNGVAPSTGNEGELWYLEKIVANVPTWVKMEGGGGSGPLLSIIDDDAETIVADSNGDVTINTQVIAAASQPLKFDKQSASRGDILIQYASAIAATDATKVGFAAFDSAHFSVDASGFVTLAGGGAAIDQIAVDANTGPGTNPVVPDGAGEITVSGAVVANHDVPLETHSRAANAYNIEVQVAKAVTGAPGVKTGAGVCVFDDTGFTVDADGYVELVGGGGPATLTLTGDDAVAVGPDGTGTINMTGEAVANGTNAKPLYFDGDAVTNTINGEIQYAAAAASTDGTKSGIAHFDSVDFTVDANGFVELVNSTNPAPGPGSVYFFDDFLGTTNTTQSPLSIAGWVNSGAARTHNLSSLSDADHPGFLAFGSAAAQGRVYLLAELFLGSGSYDFTFYAKINTLSDASDNERIYFGIADFPVGADPDNGVYFKYNYDANSGNWIGACSNSSTQTAANSSIAADTNWHKFRITINAAGTSASFFIDGTEISGSPITTNLPTGAVQLEFYRDKTAATSVVTTAIVDYVEYEYTFTTPR